MTTPVLPPKCVVKILKNVTNINDLINCLEVCKQWRRIVERILENVKYLVRDAPELERVSPSIKMMHTVYYESAAIFSTMHLSQVLPNLRVFDCAGRDKKRLTHDDAEALPGAPDSLKGVIYRLGDILNFEVMQDCPFLSMISVYYLSPRHANYFSNFNLMQLHTEQCWLDSVFSHSLLRLHIGDTLGGSYDGCYLDNLKILELNILVTEEDGYYNGFSLINKCPNVQSLFLKIDGMRKVFNFTDEDVAFNKNVRDLVIESRYGDWHFIKKILNKYPNIKNLAIRDNFKLDDTCIPEMCEMLNKLVLIDVRGCYNITRDSEDYVIAFRGNNTFPTFYYRWDWRILFEWNEFSVTNDRIVKGLNFMKYSFLRNFVSLPYLMDPYR